MPGIGNADGVVSGVAHVHDWSPGEVVLGVGADLVEVCVDDECGAVAFVASGNGSREPLPPPRD